MKNKDITPRNENGNRHGYCEIYYDNGNLWYKGTYVDGKPHGYWEGYYDNGNLCYKGNHVAGNRHGYWEEWYKNQINYYI
jgi:antitoxin component YwqK of YwqJK toxin-antitoxin module